MKVYEQGNALIDALAEQYSAEDLPSALGDVLTQMLTHANAKGAAGFDLLEAVHNAVDQWHAQLPDDDWSEDNESAVQFEEALYGDDPFGVATPDEEAATEFDPDADDVPDITATCSVCGGSIAVCDRLDDEYVWYHYTPSKCDDPDAIPGTVVVNGAPPLGAS